MEKHYTAADAEQLESLYRLYHATAGSPSFGGGAVACRKGCADCCTCNVAVTSLEAYYLVQSLDKRGRAHLEKRLADHFPEKRYQPALTFNEFAAFCIEGKNPPEEENDPMWGTCPLLDDGLCTVYRGRPFGCRSMISGQACGETGYADMPSLILTLNHVFSQYIEHLDENGGYGNLSDMLLKALEKDSADLWFEKGMNSDKTETIIPNRKIRALLVPPEHRDQVMPILRQMPGPLMKKKTTV